MNMEVVGRILESRIKRWRAMNEDFKFFEVRKEISRYFALCLSGQSFEEIYKELQDAHSKNVNILSTMHFIDRNMVFKIMYEYGEEVAKIIEKCL